MIRFIKRVYKYIVSLRKVMWCKIKYKGQIRFDSYTSKIGKNSVLEINGIDAKMRLGRIYLESNVCLNANHGGNLDISDGAYFGSNTIIVSKKSIAIGCNVSFGPNVCVYDHDHKFDCNGYKTDEFNTKEIIIGNNTWIAAGSIILKGSRIGSNCVIGAGCVIAGETIPDNSLVRCNRLLSIQQLH